MSLSEAQTRQQIIDIRYDLPGKVGHVNNKDIRKFKCPLPPLNFQKRFAEIIKHIEIQKQLTQQSLHKSEELFQSLLQRVFKGEIS